MKTLPNNLTVFNATPHSITFECPDCWGEGISWESDCEYCHDGTIAVDPDEVISAEIVERVVTNPREKRGLNHIKDVEFVTPEFVRTDEGRKLVTGAYAAGADLIVGSIIAAQAYPGDVVAMVPALGYERVPPEEKRMRADKFTCYR